MIEAVFLAQEYVFDATELARWATKELADSGIQVRMETTAIEIHSTADQHLRVVLSSESEGNAAVTSRYVFNCTYSGLNQLGGGFHGTLTRLKQEITEMALMQVTPELAGLGITVMDGPFFSMMPFPARGLHTLSHVRYTPHLHWQDQRGIDPYNKLDEYSRVSRADRMVRDVGRYLPAVLDAKYVDSLFEVKTVLVKNEGDDGRPILFEKHPELPGLFSVLGGKVDNIYDVLERINNEYL